MTGQLRCSALWIFSCRDAPENEVQSLFTLCRSVSARIPGTERWRMQAAEVAMSTRLGLRAEQRPFHFQGLSFSGHSESECMRAA